MLPARKSIKRRVETRSASATSNRMTNISKPKRLQKSLNSLSTFIHRFDNLDPTIFETSTNLNSFICDILTYSQNHSGNGAYSKFQDRWQQLKYKISNIIVILNNINIASLIDTELNKISNNINQISKSPPQSPKQARESQIMFKGINYSITVARDSSSRKQYDKLKVQIQNLKTDFGRQYEPFFKSAQIDKDWKTTIVEENRQILDKIITFCELGKETGITQFPFVDEITDLMRELSDESSDETTKRQTTTKSMIPRHSPMKFDPKKVTDLDLPTNDNSTARTKIKRVSYSARSRSEQSNTRNSQIPKPKQQTTSTKSTSRSVRASLSSFNDNDSVKSETKKETGRIKRNPKEPMSAKSMKTSKLNQTTILENNNKPKAKPALSRTLRPTKLTTSIDDIDIDEEISKQILPKQKKEILPLQESPKIHRQESEFSQKSGITSETLQLEDYNLEDSSAKNELFDSLNEIIISENEICDKLMTDLRAFESRFSKYTATIGASEYLRRFLSELRAIQNVLHNDKTSLPQHVTRLNNLIGEIEEKFETSKPLFEIEMNLDQALNYMNSLSNSLTSSVEASAELAQANAILKQYEMIKDQLEKIANKRRLEAENALSIKFNEEMEKFQKAKDVFQSAQQNNLTLKRLRKENAELKKENQQFKATKNSSNQEQHQKMLLEMKAVHQRMAQIQMERKENECDIEELDAEIEALLEQQNMLIEQLASVHS